jgi:hypothetical protein
MKTSMVWEGGNDYQSLLGLGGFAGIYKCSWCIATGYGLEVLSPHVRRL